MVLVDKRDLLLKKSGTSCPHCGARIREISMLCSRCSSGKMRFDPDCIRPRWKEIYIPRELLR